MDAACVRAVDEPQERALLIYHNDNEIELETDNHATCCGKVMPLVRIALGANGGETHFARCSSCERVVAKSLFALTDEFDG